MHSSIGLPHVKVNFMEYIQNQRVSLLRQCLRRSNIAPKLKLKWVPLVKFYRVSDNFTGCISCQILRVPVPGREVLGHIEVGQDPSDSKSNQLHADIFPFHAFIHLGYIP